MGETKVIYHIDEEETPYLVKLSPASEGVTLADLKAVLHKPHYKYFFKSQDDDFGVVKEEIVSDTARLPLFNGRVVCWLELAQGSTVGSVHEGTPSEVDSSISALPPPGIERGPGVGETRPPSFHGGLLAAHRDDLAESEVSTRPETDQEIYDDTESSITSVSQAAAERRRMDLRIRRTGGSASRKPRLPGPGIPRPSMRPPPPDSTSSMMSSELESSLYDDTEDAQSMASSRFTTSTDHTSVSQQMLRNRQKRRSKRRVPAHLARAGSISSVTDSTMSLNCITVTLNMDTVNFLGISIVGQSNKFGEGDCGIYVGSIMKGGAVALDGRIEPGDMILQVNEITFENMSNDDAVRVLREVVQKPGPIKLVVAKCWDPAPSKNYFTIPRTEPVRPIDPGAWVAHTAAVRGNMLPGGIHQRGPNPLQPHFGPRPSLGDFPGRCPSVTTLSASSIASSHADTEKFMPIGANAGAREPLDVLEEPLTNNSGMGAIVRAMQRPESNLEVRDRLWLKIKITNAFIGSDVVDWLFEKIQGFSDRREARKYASQMLKAGFIKHTVNKTSFSEQCYYTFGEDSQLNAGMAKLVVKEGNAPPPAYSLPPPNVPAPPIPNQTPPATNWGVPLWSDWQGGEISSTNYGPIYNPSAPPPTASYMPLPYGSQPAQAPGAFGYNHSQQPSLVSSGGSGSGSQKLRLAGSCSSSESEGRNSAAASDGGFRAAAGGSQLGGPAAAGHINYPSHPPPSYQATVPTQLR